MPGLAHGAKHTFVTCCATSMHSFNVTDVITHALSCCDTPWVLQHSTRLLVLKRLKQSAQTIRQCAYWQLLSSQQAAYMRPGLDLFHFHFWSGPTSDTARHLAAGPGCSKRARDLMQPLCIHTPPQQLLPACSALACMFQRCTSACGCQLACCLHTHTHTHTRTHS